MILDQFNIFGETSQVTSAATYVCPDVIDTQSNTAYSATASGALYTVAQGTQIRDMGSGNDLTVYFNVTEAFAGGTNVTFQAVVSSATNLSSPVVVGEVGPIVTASLPRGAQVAVRISPQLLAGTPLRYLGAQVVSTGTHTTGKVSGSLVLDEQDGRRAYASGFTVS